MICAEIKRCMISQTLINMHAILKDKMSHQSYYPKCVISRNTMASSTSNNSNSVGANDSEKKYMERYVFSRKSKVSNEIKFIHTKSVQYIYQKTLYIFHRIVGIVQSPYITMQLHSARILRQSLVKMYQLPTLIFNFSR